MGCSANTGGLWVTVVSEPVWVMCAVPKAVLECVSVCGVVYNDGERAPLCVLMLRRARGRLYVVERC